MISVNPLTGNTLIDMALEQRGILDKEEIDYSMKGLLPINSLTQVETLAQTLFDAVQGQKRIVVIADYDCDGATSCAVMVRMLMSLGANVGWLVPDRAIHGYGLTTKIVEEAYQGIVTGDVQSLPEIEKYVINNTFALSQENVDIFRKVLKDDPSCIEKTTVGNRSGQKPDVILTVDNGIASVEGVEYAQSLGLEVLITDHHLAGKTLPNAIIVNPNHPDCTFESKALCGVGVAWYVCAKLHQIAKQACVDSLSPTKLLPLVAIGTIADVVSLDKNNRILVENGLQQIRNQFTFMGIETLIHIGQMAKERFSSSHVGFQFGPRINAAGRIKHMGVGILNLITDNEQVAIITAMQLNHLNELRKDITKMVTDEGEAILAKSSERDYSDDYVIVLYPENEDETWHEGVIGIVAGRIKEKFNKPSIVMTYLEDEHLYKGSCRSIPSLHFKDLLDAVALEDPTIFAKYGGHAMAAGLSIHADKLDDFIRIINEKAKKTLTIDDFAQHKITDGELTLNQLDVDQVEQLEKAVWGQNFPYPQFSGRYLVINKKRMGESNQHVKLTLKQGQMMVDAVRFNCPDFDPPIGKNINLLFQPTINEWMSNKNVNLLIQDAEFEKFELVQRIDLITQNNKMNNNFNKPNDNNSSICYFYEVSALKGNTIPDFD